MVWKMIYFVVINEQGPAWDESRPMREQQKWSEHAAFVNALVDEGFILLGGPLKGAHTHRALLVVDSDNELAARTKLLEDPWMREEILRIRSIEPWEIIAGPEAILGR